MRRWSWRAQCLGLSKFRTRTNRVNASGLTANFMLFDRGSSGQFIPFDLFFPVTGRTFFPNLSNIAAFVAALLMLTPCVRNQQFLTRLMWVYSESSHARSQKLWVGYSGSIGPTPCSGLSGAIQCFPTLDSKRSTRVRSHLILKPCSTLSIP
jgi:hypothetical protein